MTEIESETTFEDLQNFNERDLARTAQMFAFEYVLESAMLVAGSLFVLSQHLRDSYFVFVARDFWFSHLMVYSPLLANYVLYQAL